MQLASVAEAASQYPLSHWTIRAWQSSGKLKRYKLGGRTLVDLEELAGMVRQETTAKATARNARRTQEGSR